MDICFIMCIFTLVFMHDNFMNFYYVKMRRNDVLRCFCEFIVMNEFYVSLVALGMEFIGTPQ